MNLWWPKPLRYCCVVLSSLVSGKERSVGLFSEFSAHLKRRDHLRGSVFDVFDVRCRRNPFEGKCQAHCCPLVILVSGFYTLSACICVLLTVHLA